MKRLLLVLLFVACAASAATVTLSTGQTCEVSGKVVIDPKTRNVFVTCKEGTTPAPVEPAPTPPPVVTPPAPPPAAACVSGYELRPLGPSGQGSVFTMQAGTVYASPLPVGVGLFGMTTSPQTPGGVMIEVGLSKCPGDLEYYKTPASCYRQFGALQCPCGGVYQPESPGVKWAPGMQIFDSFCIVPTGEKWYVNYRMIGGTGPMVYFWDPQ